MSGTTLCGVHNPMGTTRRPPQLHAVNAIRVIAEYFVVRHHILPIHLQEGEFDEQVHGPIGVDIMSFFFVLSGFVLMYSFEHEDFSTWQAKKMFVWGRVSKIYPIFLLNWLFALPKRIIDPDPKEQGCWTYLVCPPLQLIMMDSWFGCGYYFTLNGLSWFLSCLFWLWLLFPFIKDPLITHVFCYRHVWLKLWFIHMFWVSAFVWLWGYDIYTLAPFPFLRLGEFLIGCGAALAPDAWIVTAGRYWIPFTIVITLYNLERVDHGMQWLCLHEDAAHTDCSLWQAGQRQFDNLRTPCITILEKIVNKYALVWACLIHGIARDELHFLNACNEPNAMPHSKHWTFRILHADIFKILNKVSPTLYLSHFSMFYAIIFLGEHLLGWMKNKWRDDTLLFAVYLACYGLQYALQWLMDRTSKLFSSQATDLKLSEDDKEPLVLENVGT